MNQNSSFHPPIVLADARERRARKQRPYPAVCDHLPEADERETQPRPPVAAVGTAFVALLLLIALVAWLARFLPKG
jgi:hypothetical protein